MDSSSVFGRNSLIAKNAQKKCTFCGGAYKYVEKCFKKIRKEKEQDCAASHLDDRSTEQTPQKCFRCGSEDHLITKCPKPPKDNEKRINQVRFNENVHLACDNGENNSDQMIYAYIARMSNNEKFPSGNFGDSSQLNSWILDSGATCHMTPEVSDFIPG